MPDTLATSVSNPFFSIVIPTLNEEKYLPALLEDLTKQTYDSFEVFVVDGHSDDKTAKKAQNFAQHLPLTLVTSPKRDVSHQRNMGIKVSQGKWIVFMDADDRIPPYFLVGLKYQLDRHPSTDAFTTWVDTSKYHNRDEKFIANAYNLGIFSNQYLNKPTTVGAMLGIRRSLGQKLSFRPMVDDFEDHDLIDRLNKQGYSFRIFREPRYFFSMRRFKKEGTLKMIATYAQANMNLMLGVANTDLVKNYVMKGGSYYDDANGASDTQSPPSFFRNLNQLIITPAQEFKRLRSALSRLFS
jgi:glycosyltransferase involved in cell wall biosynthesis